MLLVPTAKSNNSGTYFEIQLNLFKLKFKTVFQNQKIKQRINKEKLHPMLKTTLEHRTSLWQLVQSYLTPYHTDSFNRASFYCSSNNCDTIFCITHNFNTLVTEIHDKSWIENVFFNCFLDCSEFRHTVIALVNFTLPCTKS